MYESFHGVLTEKFFRGFFGRHTSLKRENRVQQKLPRFPESQLHCA